MLPWFNIKYLETLVWITGLAVHSKWPSLLAAHTASGHKSSVNITRDMSSKVTCNHWASCDTWCFLQSTVLTVTDTSGFQIENKISGTVLKQIPIILISFTCWSKADHFGQNIFWEGKFFYVVQNYSACIDLSADTEQRRNSSWWWWPACQMFLLWAEMVGQVIKHKTEETTWWCWPTCPECSPAVSPCE